MVKSILYDIDGDLRHYILVRPFRDGFQYAFGISKDQQPTFITRWSVDYFTTENDAILAANKNLKGHRPSDYREPNERPLMKR
jgi:hypothetical protein